MARGYSVQLEHGHGLSRMLSMPFTILCCAASFGPEAWVGAFAVLPHGAQAPAILRVAGKQLDGLNCSVSWKASSSSLQQAVLWTAMLGGS